MRAKLGGPITGDVAAWERGAVMGGPTEQPGDVPSGGTGKREDPTTDVRTFMPFAATLGITVATYTPDEVRMTKKWAPELCTSGGVLHGGALMALADTCGGACAFLNLPPGSKGTTTIESKTNFLRAVGSGEVEAVSRPLHVGRTIAVVETDLRDADGRRVARVTQSQLVLGATR